MKRTKIIALTSFILFNISARAQQVVDTTAIMNSIFPRGEKSTSDNNFNGGVWIKRFISPRDSLDCIVALVTVEPGVRTNWHTHPGGTNSNGRRGHGLLPGKGKPRQVIHKGDVVKCPPGVIHWHGASPNGEFAHLVVAPDAEKGQVKWLQRVTEEEYNGLK